MLIERATSDDVASLALLKWRDVASFSRPAQSLDEFTTDLARWWHEHEHTHFAFVARTDEGEIVGAAWIALLPRVPRPGAIDRLSADVQSVFVMPEHRRGGIGTELVAAAYQHASNAGAAKVTVNSSEGAVSLYRRLGFDHSPVLFVRSASD
jgi:GNAT superfamily N-acetyltransferase